VSSIGSILPLTTGVAPSNKYFFALDTNFGISELGVGGSGQLTTGTPPTVTGSVMSFTPNGQFAIIANPLDNTLNSYELDASGTLVPVSSLTITGAIDGILVEPSGRFVYATNAVGDSTIEEFSISEAGALAPIGSVLTGGIGSASLTVSPAGFFYCANPNSFNVSEFSMDQSTGLLTFVSTYGNWPPAEGGPIWIGITPNGKYAYASGGAGITQFAIDPSTGALTSVSVTPTPAGASAMDPSGTHLYGADEYTFSTFVIGSTGSLTPGVTVQLGGTMQQLSFAFAQR
jgi:6-phosphogluconolactonase (cycloisomerase 2 family)